MSTNIPNEWMKTSTTVTPSFRKRTLQSGSHKQAKAAAKLKYFIRPSLWCAENAASVSSRKKRRFQDILKMLYAKKTRKTAEGVDTSCRLKLNPQNSGVQSLGRTGITPSRDVEGLRGFWRSCGIVSVGYTRQRNACSSHEGRSEQIEVHESEPPECRKSVTQDCRFSCAQSHCAMRTQNARKH